MADLEDAPRRLARAAAAVANYCDHAEHLEEVDRAVIAATGRELRALAVEVAAAHGIDIVAIYRERLEAVERRHPLYPAGGFAAVDAISAAATWRDLQIAQREHDRNYHPDVFGLSRYEQLRHYAFHLAKLAGAAADAVGGDTADFLERRLPDALLFGIKLATLVGEALPNERRPAE